MPYTIATVLINEFGETIADTPIGAEPSALVVLENGTFAALVRGHTEREMGTTKLRLSGSLEPVSDRWHYVGSTAHGMGVWHLWYDIEHSNDQFKAFIQAQEQEVRERNEKTEERATNSTQSKTTKEKGQDDPGPEASTPGSRSDAGEDTDTDRDDGTTPADHD